MKKHIEDIRRSAYAYYVSGSQKDLISYKLAVRSFNDYIDRLTK